MTLTRIVVLTLIYISPQDPRSFIGSCTRAAREGDPHSSWHKWQNAAGGWQKAGTKPVGFLAEFKRRQSPKMQSGGPNHACDDEEETVPKASGKGGGKKAGLQAG